MKIAFWSNSPGKSGVTGNLSCISILSAMIQPSKMVLFENHSNINNLGSMFLNQNSYDKLKEENSYFVENGLGRILNCCDMGDDVSSGIVLRTCLSVFDQRVFYLPPGGMNRDLLEFRLNRHAENVMDLLEQVCGTVCVDLSSSSLESSRKILKEADLIVVNLCQNDQLLSHFFRNFSEIRKKAFYIIGNYDPESIIRKSDIVRRFGISGNMVGTIPYNRRFADALTKGNVVTYLLKNFSCGADNINYEFISAAKETACLFEQVKEAYSKEKIGGEGSEKKGDPSHAVSSGGNSVSDTREGGCGHYQTGRNSQGTGTGTGTEW